MFTKSTVCGGHPASDIARVFIAMDGRYFYCFCFSVVVVFVFLSCFMGLFFRSLSFLCLFSLLSLSILVNIGDMLGITQCLFYESFD